MLCLDIDLVKLAGPLLAGLAHDEAVRKGDGAGNFTDFTIQSLQEQSSARTTDLSGGVEHGRQLGRNQCRGVNIVITGDGKLAGDGEASCPGAVKHSDRDQVVRGDYRVGWILD